MQVSTYKNQLLMSTALFLLLLLVVAACRVVTPTAVSSLGLTPGCKTSCGGVDIPYPFGIGTGCFRKGFEIDCVNNNVPALAGTPDVRVVRLSVDPAVSQVMLPIGFQCFNNASSPGKASVRRSGATRMNKDGVYRISSTRNMLVVIGCNTMAYTASDRTDGGSYSHTYYTGCMSYCNNSASARDELCAGVGCCHVDIPPGITDNYFNFLEYDHSGMMDYSPCDYAFLADRTNYTFRRSHLFMDTNHTSPVWLDWAIRDNDTTGGAILSCADAAAKTTATDQQFACKSYHSDCVDSLNGGYNCNCSKGYQGNAYVIDGCTNIDECADNENYPCYGVCEDTPGFYECTCRPGYRSNDPRTERCTPTFPLAARIFTSVTLGLFILASLSFILVLRKEQRKTLEFYKKNGGPTLEKAKNIKILKKEDLEAFFKDSNFIGGGGFGKVYKGVVDNEEVAIKKPISGTMLETKQFANEVIIQSQVMHKNIVRLVGCCLVVDAPILVYEFVSKGSLDDILHKVGNKKPLSLDARVSIAAESARGLSYMHSEAHTTILHGDVKPANILLNDDFVPKISDFGISRLIARDKRYTCNVIGDLTYIDPVYIREGRLTEKSDVYSFGIVILELISREKATRDHHLVKSFLEHHKKLKKSSEPLLQNTYPSELYDKEIAVPGDMEHLHSLAGMAVECLDLDVDKRPRMADVAQRLLILNENRSRRS